jgi:hypothetical protein
MHRTSKPLPLPPGNANVSVSGAVRPWDETGAEVQVTTPEELERYNVHVTADVELLSSTLTVLGASAGVCSSSLQTALMSAVELAL